jgi:hypothetical protein
MCQHTGWQQQPLQLQTDRCSTSKTTQLLCSTYSVVMTIQRPRDSITAGSSMLAPSVCAVSAAEAFKALHILV